MDANKEPYGAANFNFAFNDIIDFLPDAIFATDTEQHIIIWNKALEKITGISSSEVLGRGSSENAFLFHGNAKAAFLDLLFQDNRQLGSLYSNINSEGESITGEIFCPELTNDKGSWISIKASPLHDQNGNVVGAIKSIKDISKRKQAEATMTHSRELLSYIIKHSTSSVVVLDRDLRYVYTSQVDFDGYKPVQEDIIGKYHYDILPGLPQRWRDIHQRCLKGEILSADEDPYYRMDNTIVWTKWECRPWYEADGSIGGIVIYTEIITDRKNAIDNLQKSEERFRIIFEKAPLGIGVFDFISRKPYQINQKFAEIFGRTVQEMADLDWQLISHQDDMEENLKYRELILSKKIKDFNMVKRYFKPDGTIIWVTLTSTILDNTDNENPKELCIIQDISEVVRSQEEQKDSEIKYRNLYHEYQAKQILLLSLLNSIPDLIFYKDTSSVYMGCNKAFEKFVGLESEKIVGKTDFDLFDKQMATLFREMDMAMMDQKSAKRNEELVPYPDGSQVYLETVKTPYYDFEGNVLGMIGISRDITERKDKEEEILYLNYRDVLTGLYNRRFFEEEKSRLDTERQLPLSVIVADVDGLKLINDGFGYANGDKLLVEVAKILKQCCRSEDIISRIGGDEFCILLPKTSMEFTKKIINRICNSCELSPIQFGTSDIKPSISMGYAAKTSIDENLLEIVMRAEDSMRRSKLLGRKSVRGGLMSSIKATMLEKSHETAEHAERLIILSKAIGKELNLSDDMLLELELAAALHDIGKMSIDQKILIKPGKLTAEEWNEIKKHPETGYRIAQATSELMPISEYILSHHERWDGKGYPQGLKGKEIPLLARIVTIVDSYDAMTENRPYRTAMSKAEAIAEISRNAGLQFDPEIAKVFIEKVLLEEKVETRG